MEATEPVGSDGRIADIRLKGLKRFQRFFQGLSVLMDINAGSFDSSMSHGFSHKNDIPGFSVEPCPEGPVYDVIDGKQRLESIFMFMGIMRGMFEAKTQLSEKESVESVDWTLLKRRELQHRITGYEIPVIEVDGELSG